MEQGNGSLRLEPQHASQGRLRRRNRQDRIRIVECKAESKEKPLDESYVRKFFTETVPALIKSKCGNHAPSRCQASIWTTGIVGDQARKALAELSLKKYVEPELVDRQEIVSNLPPALSSTKRLVETIAAVGM